MESLCTVIWAKNEMFWNQWKILEVKKGSNLYQGSCWHCDIIQNILDVLMPCEKLCGFERLSWDWLTLLFGHTCKSQSYFGTLHCDWLTFPFPALGFSIWIVSLAAASPSPLMLNHYFWASLILWIPFPCFLRRLSVMMLCLLMRGGCFLKWGLRHYSLYSTYLDLHIVEEENGTGHGCIH